MNQLPPNSTQSQPKRWSIWPMLLLALVLVGLLVTAILWLKPTTQTAPTETTVSHQTALSSTTQNNSMPVLASSTSSVSNQKPLPKSLQGTQVDGEVIIDDKQQLVVTAGLRRLFDYFLSAQGEEPLTQIKQRVIDYIRSHTPEPAAGQAIAIFEQYLNYLQAVSTLDKQLGQKKSPSSELDLGAIKSHMQAVKQLQSQYFDAKTREAFFGEEDTLNDYTFRVVEANQNKQLDAAQRQAIIDQARNNYISSFKDPAVQQKLKEQQNIESLLAETQAMKQRGASQAEINAMRSKYVTTDAVQRLEQLDASEAAFNQRINSYKDQRNQIISQLGNTPQAQQQVLQLQQSMFTPEERLRLDVLAK